MGSTRVSHGRQKPSGLPLIRLTPRRRLRAASILAASFLLLHAIAPPPTAAANYIACIEGGIGPINIHQGQGQSGGQKHGASAVLENDYLNQCSPETHFPEYSGNFAYVNVVPTAGGFNNIVQIGVGNCRGFGTGCATGMQYYWGWGRSPSAAGCAGKSNIEPYTNRISGWSSGPKTLTVVHRNNQWELQISGVVKKTVPESDICWTPGMAVFFGEAWDSGDAIGGTSADPFSFTQAKYTGVENGGWFSTSWGANSICNYEDWGGNPYDCDHPSSTTVNVWTRNR